MAMSHLDLKFMPESMSKAYLRPFDNKQNELNSTFYSYKILPCVSLGVFLSKKILPCNVILFKIKFQLLYRNNNYIQGFAKNHKNLLYVDEHISIVMKVIMKKDLKPNKKEL
jgi:hypothetical protein